MTDLSNSIARPLLTAALLLGATGLGGPALAQEAYPPVTVGAPRALPPATPGHPELYVATVHLDGTTALTKTTEHPAEPFPTEALPPGGGLLLTPPDAQGQWRIRTFVFQPAQVTVHEGDVVGLNFVGVQGATHRIAVEGVEGVIVLHRGEVRRVEVPATHAGTLRFASLDRLPSMQGQIVVLPAD